MFGFGKREIVPVVELTPKERDIKELTRLLGPSEYGKFSGGKSYAGDNRLRDELFEKIKEIAGRLSDDEIEDACHKAHFIGDEREVLFSDLGVQEMVA